MTTGIMFAESLHEHVASLRRYAIVLTRNQHDAEDLVQEALTKALASAGTWIPGSDLRVWLFRILHNTYVSDLRKKKVRNVAKLDLPDPVVGDEQVRRVELQQVLDALDQLPQAQRQPIVMVALNEMSYADAAKALGVPLGTFYSRLGRGREALRRIVDGVRQTKIKLVV